MIAYTYNVQENIFSKKINLKRLKDEILNAGLSSSYSHINKEANNFDIYFATGLSLEDLTALENIIETHSGEPYPEKTEATDVKIIENLAPAPFASKILSNGQSIFKRVHGTSVTINENTTDTIKFIVPYLQAKITGLEILGASHGDTANFNIYDTPTGAISTVPNLKLNQLGFNVFLREKQHIENSQYDADIIEGMVLEVEFTNNTDSEKLIAANFIIHEVV